MQQDDNSFGCGNSKDFYFGGRCGFLGLLDLPVGSIIHLDGGDPLVLQRNDFVGFTNHLLRDANAGDADHVFHLVTIRAGCCTASNISSSNSSSGSSMGVVMKEHQNSSSSAVTVGFVLVDTTEDDRNLILRYDPTTEEVSAKPVDPTTAQHLLDQVQQNKIDPHRVVDYARVVMKNNAAADDDDDESAISKRLSWRELTRFISPKLLTKRGIAAGEKIVPGAYYDETDQHDNLFLNNINKDSPPLENDQDGKALIYPSIPVLSTGTSCNSGQKTHHLQLHLGTKRFLARMEPSQRTRFVIDPHPGARVLQWILKEYYDNSWQDLVGDVQLSYIIFLRLSCYSSLMHWRDLVAMLSLVDMNISNDSTPCVGECILEQQQKVDLYIAFLNTLIQQIQTMDPDFFDDAELSGDNFLIPSLCRLLQNLSHDMSSESSSCSSNTNYRELEAARSKLQHELQSRFPCQFLHYDPSESHQEEANNTMEVDPALNDDDGDDDDDGPVVVAIEEVEASLARQEQDSLQQHRHNKNMVVMEYSQSLQQQYPLLFAAKLQSEDIVMTCARVLDQKGDVSLVREAADYLEQVEAHHHHDSCQL